ncbi:MAG: group II intron reverse transcriptase domain-containing protein [Verrucomicrobiales bacterium]|nr:group II intron reverse transcriptase domain-containing protein [Verrucomicrobiales bacterium]
MKRSANLMKQIAARDNLCWAAWRAGRGKRQRPEVRAFMGRLTDELAALQTGLNTGAIELGDYHYFTIHDPKERRICAASFRERVLHHAVMRICEPVFERGLIHHTYACRRGKGQTGAVQAAERNSRRHAWFLKLDVRKYFDSIDHNVLLGLLERRFKDVPLLGLFGRLLDTYQTAPGKGLPIGNLTSQHFANYYLDPLDRFVTATSGFGAYVRYMDDFVIWHSDRARLRALRTDIEAFLADRLRLAVKERTPVHPVGRGLDFLGFRLRPASRRLDAHSRKRFVRKYRGCLAAFGQGEWTESEMQRRLTALFAFVRQADTYAFRRRVLERFGDVSD